MDDLFGVDSSDARGDDGFGAFCTLHEIQLLTSGVPRVYWRRLHEKLQNQIYDAGHMFMMVTANQEEEESESSDDESGKTASNHGNTIKLNLPPLKVVVSNEDGLTALDSNNIYLVDHAWTYRVSDARQQLEEIPGLLDRMVALMHIPTDATGTKDLVETVMREMWKFNQTYNIGNQEVSAEDQVPVWYIMDEFGSHIQHCDTPTCKMTPFYYIPSQLCFTLLWPIIDLDYADEITRDYAVNIKDPLKRKIALLPWKHTNLTDIDTEQVEPDLSYFGSVFSETFPTDDDVNNCLLTPRTDGCYKVFTDVQQVTDYLKHPKFILVEDELDADILWIRAHFKDFKQLCLDGRKYINQFPCEALLTTKDLLAVTARRAIPNNPKAPKWLQKTFDLSLELPKFVSYFQQKEQRGEDNVWVCKVWNLARSLDSHVTNDLNYIIRLTETSKPKIACEYITNPVLFQRDGIGGVKMDMSYTVFLASVKPLKLFVHKKFYLRFAYRPFSLDRFDDYGKHFTVMNYMDYSKLLKVHFHEFIDLFEEQYPDYKWCDIETNIHRAIKELFQAVTTEPAPKGLVHCPPSRALYSIDFMLKWECDEKGDLYFLSSLS
ncbi:tubulin--tyrosine ligase-like protein 12 [Saccoglossus kowalevskii]|uniref:Tubulin--tyrosine ligase-like protein 12-like n=1 Tax=Saccoglossus kowalevskii TaxID=10224 RepID=A0ABM0GK32_SACKO|nr:PREDICTED: tubulin--tyrosine ligase-like protein 12-like [Saccoglossus kowalevskii]